MTHQCFYCSDVTEDKKIHVVTFQVTDTDRNEMLCDECYQEWLQGIKG
ncbi:hypothetical protein [Peribacillus simplex]|nr:hypothetical protein [Peribacillus simplex]